MDATSAAYFHHQDVNFRVVMLTDESGGVVERYGYTAYGEPTVYGGEDENGEELANAYPISRLGNPLMHQGLFRDAETATYQNRFRQYDSRLGRFARSDALGYVGGLNLYEYVGSRPTKHFDSLGLQVAEAYAWQIEAEEAVERYYERRREAEELGLSPWEYDKYVWGMWWQDANARPQEDVMIGFMTVEAFKRFLADYKAAMERWAEFDKYISQLLQLTWAFEYRLWTPKAKQYYTNVKYNSAVHKFGEQSIRDLIARMRKIWKPKGPEGPMWPLCCFIQNSVCWSVEGCPHACCDFFTRRCLEGGDNACHARRQPGGAEPPPNCPSADCCFTGRIN